MIAGGGTLKVEERKITPLMRQLLDLLPDLRPNLDPNRLGDRIRTLRKQRQTSAQTLADSALVSKNYLYEIERGTAPNPSAHAVMRLAEQLKTTMDDLMGVIRPDGSDPADAAFYRYYLSCSEEVRARIRAVANVLIAEGS